MKGEASEAIVRGSRPPASISWRSCRITALTGCRSASLKMTVFTYAPVNNEAVGVGVCAGAFFGGKTPALMIPTSGFLVATWPLASLHNFWNIPLFLLIPYRGDIGDAQPVMRTYQFTTEPILRDLQSLT